ncbi:hypothetical protein P4E94_19545 [Pontiellaceae bacterium B12219]|nr:hypothetical protein [Pontiellaceae bacterium B12219]
MDKDKPVKLLFTPLVLIILGSLWLTVGIMMKNQDVKINNEGLAVLFGCGIVYIITGLGLFKPYKWSVDLAILLCSILFLLIPIGTAIALVIVPILKRLSKSMKEESKLNLTLVPERKIMKNTTIDTIQKCKLCGGRFTIREVLSQPKYFWPEVDVVVCKASCCDHKEELSIKNNKVERGYVYAAASPHFCGMEIYDVPSLQLIENKDRLVFIFDGKKHEVENNFEPVGGTYA